MRDERSGESKEASTSDVLRLTGLKKTSPGFTLDVENLSVEAATIAGFVERNGAGKTTTIKTILGLVSPDEGDRGEV